MLGALAGGWISDRLGRRKVFIGTMVMFIVLGLRIVSVNMWMLCGIRFLLGFPLGSDIFVGYAYIMETMRAASVR